MGGFNFEDVLSKGKYLYNEKVISYVENETVYHTLEEPVPRTKVSVSVSENRIWHKQTKCI